MSIYSDIFKLKETKEIKKFSVLTESEEEDGYEWAVIFHLPNKNEEYDDTFENTQEEAIIVALDADEAVKYAEQYIRVQQKENDEWQDAEILSITRKN